MGNGGRTNSNVDPLSSSPSDHLDDLSARGSPDDGVVDHRDALPPRDLLHGVQLDLDPEMPDGLSWFDEGSTYIVVPDEAQLDGNICLMPIADGGRKARIGCRDDNVRIRGMLPGQLNPELSPHRVNVSSEDETVGTCEIDEFECAMGRGHGGEGEKGMESIFVNNHHLPGSDLPLEFRPNEIEGAGLRGNEIGVLLTPQYKGSKAMGVAHRDHLVLAQKEKTISPFYLLESPDCPLG